MLKKVLLTFLLFILSTDFCSAGALYVGANLGEVTNTTDTNNGNFRGMPVGVSLGYGVILSQSFFLGGELFSTLATMGFQDNGLASSYNFGFSLLPGILLGDHSMFYGRVSIVGTRFSPSSSTGSGKNSTVVGGQVGVGLQAGLTRNLDLRSEYVYSAYTSFHQVASPRQDQYNLGLVYRFE